MKEFPDILSVKNKENFNSIYKNRLKCYMRRDLYEHILSHKENEYFSLDEFNTKVSDIELTKEIVKELIVELEKLGWKCKLSFGETGLFIFSEQMPSNCFPDN